MLYVFYTVYMSVYVNVTVFCHIIAFCLPLRKFNPAWLFYRTLLSVQI